MHHLHIIFLFLIQGKCSHKYLKNYQSDKNVYEHNKNYVSPRSFTDQYIFSLFYGYIAIIAQSTIRLENEGSVSHGVIRF